MCMAAIDRGQRDLKRRGPEQHQASSHETHRVESNSAAAARKEYASGDRQLVLPANIYEAGQRIGLPATLTLIPQIKEYSANHRPPRKMVPGDTGLQGPPELARQNTPARTPSISFSVSATFEWTGPTINRDHASNAPVTMLLFCRTADRLTKTRSRISLMADTKRKTRPRVCHRCLQRRCAAMPPRSHRRSRQRRGQLQSDGRFIIYPESRCRCRVIRCPFL